MSFLQPWLLLALPLIAIPIIIHLVNQWRYQTKPWAAMMFLLAAKSMHRGMAKLRQWLILAMRTLAIAGLIVAISRPLMSGLMGFVAGGRIDTTIVMLDRSPSMLEESEATRESKLKTGLRQLRETLATQPSSRWILIDSARPSPQEFGSLDALIDSPIASGTSAIAPWASMFQSALDYIQKNRPSQTNLWICSDMRKGDWQADNGPWSAIREAYQKLPSQVRFLAITYPAIASTNRSLSVDQVRLERGEDRQSVVMTIRVTRAGAPTVNETVPVQLATGSGRSEVPIELVNGVGEIKDYHLPIDDTIALGWGKATIPADDNPADNEQYFVFDVPPDRHSVIVCEQPEAVLPFQIAAEISKDVKSKSTVTVVSQDDMTDAPLGDASMIVWQGALPSGEKANQLEDHLDRGRTLWLLPSLQMIDQGVSNGPPTAFAGFRWLDWIQLAEAAKPETWRSDEGLLAATQSGTALPVGEIAVMGYATFEGDATSLATLQGGKPLLAKLNTPRGSAYVCTTFPSDPVSTMGKNGIPLFVSIQRSIEQASATLGNAVRWDATAIVRTEQSTSGTSPDRNLDATARFNLAPLETWQPITTDERFLSNEMGLHSGVFESGAKMVAVNRPQAEDVAESISGEQFTQLLKGLDVVQIEDSAGSTKKIQQEIWRVFLVLMIVALLVEALLSLPRKQAVA